MKYSERILSVILLCCLKLINCTVQRNQAGDYNIEEFIKKLMTSQKFNELADIIAEKAAIKIKRYEDGGDALPRNDETIDQRQHEPLRAHKEKENHYSEEQLKYTKKKKSKLALINTKAFKAKDASEPMEKLSLKYKYLSKSTPKDELVDTKTAEQSYSREELKEESQEKKNHKNYSDDESIAQENEKSKYYDETLSKNSKQNLKANPPKTYNNLEPLRKHDSIVKTSGHKNSRKTSKERVPSSLNDDFISDDAESKQKEFEDTRVTVLDRFDDTEHRVFRSNDNADATTHKKSRTMNDINTKYGLPKNNAEMHEPEAEISNNVDKLTSSTMKIYRKEGDKEFTFQSSPDYDEYHEQLAKLSSPNMEVYLKL